jgi:hypothetical protein
MVEMVITVVVICPDKVAPCTHSSYSFQLPTLLPVEFAFSSKPLFTPASFILSLCLFRNETISVIPKIYYHVHVSRYCCVVCQPFEFVLIPILNCTCHCQCCYVPDVTSATIASIWIYVFVQRCLTALLSCWACVTLHQEPSLSAPVAITMAGQFKTSSRQ